MGGVNDDVVVHHDNVEEFYHLLEETQPLPAASTELCYRPIRLDDHTIFLEEAAAIGILLDLNPNAQHKVYKSASLAS